MIATQTPRLNSTAMSRTPLPLFWISTRSLTVVAADERVILNHEVSRPSSILPAAHNFHLALTLESLAAELGR